MNSVKTVSSAPLVAMCRGELPYSEEVKDLAELAICAYQDGKAGREDEPVEADPGLPAWTAECLDKFLRAAHEQGQKDAEEKVYG